MRKTRKRVKRTRERSLYNQFFPVEVRVWYRLHACGCQDLVPSTCAVPAIGTPPKWWDPVENDLETMLGIGYSTHYVPVGDSDSLQIRYSWLSWAIESGIAPGQPFQVAIGAPESYQTSYEYDEWDVTWGGELIQVARLPLTAAARRWAAFLQKLERRTLQALAQYELDAQALQRDTGAMYVHCHSYLANGIQNEASVSVAVRTRHHPYSHPIRKYLQASWGQGRNDNNDKAAALAELEVTACKENPYLCPEVIRAMEMRSNP
jgi:hypothetical protein